MSKEDDEEQRQLVIPSKQLDEKCGRKTWVQ